LPLKILLSRCRHRAAGTTAAFATLTTAGITAVARAIAATVAGTNATTITLADSIAGTEPDDGVVDFDFGSPY